MLNQEDPFGTTPLSTCMSHKNLKLFENLILKGASVNYVNASGVTVFHLAVQHELYEFIQLLIQKGANPHI